MSYLTHTPRKVLDKLPPFRRTNSATGKPSPAPRSAATRHGGRCAPDGLIKPCQAGLTLLEVCIVMGILAFSASWAIPGLDGLMARNEVATEVMRLKDALATARNTAITRGIVITLCPSQDGRRCVHDWTAPLSTLQGEVDQPPHQRSVLRRHSASQLATITYRGDHRPVRYQPTGRAAGHNGTLRLCGRHGEGASVIVSNFGRVRVRDDTPTICQSMLRLPMQQTFFHGRLRRLRLTDRMPYDRPA